MVGVERIMKVVTNPRRPPDSASRRAAPGEARSLSCCPGEWRLSKAARCTSTLPHQYVAAYKPRGWAKRRCYYTVSPRDLQRARPQVRRTPCTIDTTALVMTRSRTGARLKLSPD